MSNEIVEVVKENVLAAFVSGDGLDPIINQARELVDGFEPDLSTDKGRKAIASLAAKVAKLKVKLDDMGKELVGDWKAKAKIVDGSRKKMRDELDDLKIQARKPLTDWENKEKDRVQAHRESIGYIDGWVAQHDANGVKLSLDDLELSLSHVNEVDTGELEEFELEGVKVKDKAITVLTGWIDEEKKRLETEAELARLRVEDEKRKQQEHEDNLKREAAEQAKAEAEDKAKADQEKADREKREAIEREEKAKASAAESERQRIAAEERAKFEAERAESDRLTADAAAKQAVIDARDAEIKRQKDIEDRAKADQERREANKRHVGKIRKEAKESLMQFVDEDTARKIVLAITNDKILNVTINY